MKPPLKFNRAGSLSLLLLSALFIFPFSANGGAQSLCVQLKPDTGDERSVPVSLGSKLRLSFLHSIYGSRIDEVFSVIPDGFRLTQLRYSEARLAEFYGHEFASHINDAWVVTPAPVFLSSLNLRSSGAAMSLHFDQSPNVKQVMIPPGGALRLTVASCDRNAND